VAFNILFATLLAVFADHSLTISFSSSGTGSGDFSKPCIILVVVIFPLGTGIIVSPPTIALDLGLPKPVLFLHYVSLLLHKIKVLV